MEEDPFHSLEHLEAYTRASLIIFSQNGELRNLVGILFGMPEDYLEYICQLPRGAKLLKDVFKEDLVNKDIIQNDGRKYNGLMGEIGTALVNRFFEEIEYQ